MDVQEQADDPGRRCEHFQHRIRRQSADASASQDTQAVTRLPCLAIGFPAASAS